MFFSFTSRLRSEVETLKRVLDTHDRLRTLLFPNQDAAQQGNENLQNNTEEANKVPDAEEKYLPEIRSIAPTKSAWQVYDHCAAFTRLYAVYEQFIEDLVSEYLRMLPGLYPVYQDLPPSVTKQHRIGVGQILLKFGKDGPFKDLQMPQIIQGLSQGELGNPGYVLFPDAFLTDPQNYRAEMVVKVFSYVGLDDCWAWVEKHPLMTDFMQQHRDSNETPKTLLHEFVEYRNKASHTVVGDIVATDEIKSIADFVVVLSETLAQLVMKQVVRRKKELGEILVLGRTIHKFGDNIVGARMFDGDIAVGDELLVIQRQSCLKATVLSIQIEKISYASLKVEEGQEIGIRLSIRANEKADLLRLKTAQEIVTSEEPLPEPISEDEDQDEEEARTAES
jgi:hypothetical protein